MKRIVLFAAIVLGMVAAQAQNLVIDYAYDGKLGPYGIADKATATYDSRVIGRAWAVQIIEQNSGPDHLLVREELYDEYGKVAYKGTLEFEFSFGGAVLVKEIRAFGEKKPFSIFTSWPNG